MGNKQSRNGREPVSNGYSVFEGKSVPSGRSGGRCRDAAIPGGVRDSTRHFRDVPGHRLDNGSLAEAGSETMTMRALVSWALLGVLMWAVIFYVVTSVFFPV
jgi:hypothetical protein